MRSQANISTSDQRCFNVVNQRCSNVDRTLKMKQNPTSDFQLWTTLIQHRCPTLKQRWINVAQCRYNRFSTLHNVVSTLMWNYLNVFSMWPQNQLKIYWRPVKVKKKYGFTVRFISFILLNEKIFFTVYINY